MVWGPSNKMPSKEACCQACQAAQGTSPGDMKCNVWVYCGDVNLCGDQFQDCWLKHLAHPDGTLPQVGESIGWTSGLVGNYTLFDDVQSTIEKGAHRKYHSITTAQGSAMHWQVRIHYYWFQQQQQACLEQDGDDCHMGGFTRILHSGEPDDLMDEIPTFVAQPLPPEATDGYLVLNRPYAVLQWLQQTSIPEKYVLMLEPDHLLMRPLPNLMLGENPASFPFFYIEPSRADYKLYVEKFSGKLQPWEFEDIPPIGNSPTFMARADLAKMADTWLNVSRAIFNTPETRKEWGWVLEMYGFAISTYLHNLHVDLHLHLMAQPPWDESPNLFNGNPYYILHYTYGKDFNANGEFTPGKVGDWRFDKRTYQSSRPPADLADPPDNVRHRLVRQLIQMLKVAMNDIPDWDEYRKGAKAVAKIYQKV